MSENPFVAPAVQESADRSAELFRMPGLSRRSYGIIAGGLLFGLVLLPAVVSELVTVRQGATFQIGLAEVLLLLIVLLPMTASRMKNMAMNRLYAALLLVPPVTILVLLLAFSAPTAWRQHRTFDTASTLITTTFIASLLLVVWLQLF
jgi:hypothetical protein